MSLNFHPNYLWQTTFNEILGRQAARSQPLVNFYKLPFVVWSFWTQRKTKKSYKKWTEVSREAASEWSEMNDFFLTQVNKLLINIPGYISGSSCIVFYLSFVRIEFSQRRVSEWDILECRWLSYDAGWRYAKQLQWWKIPPLVTSDYGQLSHT